MRQARDPNSISKTGERTSLSGFNFSLCRLFGIANRLLLQTNARPTVFGSYPARPVNEHTCIIHYTIGFRTLPYRTLAGFSDRTNTLFGSVRALLSRLRPLTREILRACLEVLVIPGLDIRAFGR